MNLLKKEIDLGVLLGKLTNSQKNEDLDKEENMSSFEKVSNIEFTGYQYIEDVDRELPCYTLHEPSTEEWNRRAKIQNTKMFVQKFNRKPKDYEEVMVWLWSLFPNEDRPEEYKNVPTAATARTGISR